MRVYTPFLATLIVTLIVGSMIATNVEVVAQSGARHPACLAASPHSGAPMPAWAPRGGAA